MFGRVVSLLSSNFTCTKSFPDDHVAVLGMLPSQFPFNFYLSQAVALGKRLQRRVVTQTLAQDHNIMIDMISNSWCLPKSTLDWVRHSSMSKLLWFLFWCCFVHLTHHGCVSKNSLDLSPLTIWPVTSRWDRHNSHTGKDQITFCSKQTNR